MSSGGEALAAKLAPADAAAPAQRGVDFFDAGQVAARSSRWTASTSMLPRTERSARRSEKMRG
jgi:hypothetical protein